MTETGVLAFDDGYFPACYKSRRGKTVLAGVTISGSFVIRKITFSTITVDGREATQSIIEQARLHQGYTAIMLDGVTYAGFDVVDPEVIYDELKVPVIVVQQYPLNIKSVEEALRKNFQDWFDRLEIIEKVTYKYRYLDTRWKIVQYCAIGLEPREAETMLRSTMIYSPIPEPLRIAHAVASTISRKLYEEGYL